MCRRFEHYMHVLLLLPPVTCKFRISGGINQMSEDSPADIALDEKLTTDPSIPTAFSNLRDDMMLLEVQFALFTWSSHKVSLFHDFLRRCDHATLRATGEQEHSYTFIFFWLHVAGDFVAAVRVEPVLVLVLVLAFACCGCCCFLAAFMLLYLLYLFRSV